MNITYCVRKKQTTDDTYFENGRIKYKTIDQVDCNNPEDKKFIEDGLESGGTFKSLRKQRGYAGVFKKISDEKHDDIYSTNQEDAVLIHLGLKDGYEVPEIMNELGYTKYGWEQTTHGYAMQKLWHNENYDTVVTPSTYSKPIQNYKSIFLKHKEGKDVDVQNLWWWVNDHQGLTEDEIKNS